MKKGIAAAWLPICISLCLLLAACSPGSAQMASSSASSAATTQASAATQPSTTLGTQPTTAPATEATTAPATEPSSATGTAPVATVPQPVLEDLQALYEQNPHTIGWIEIEGTMVNYPVLQTPNEPEWWNYYLHRNFYGEYEYRGCIYMRETCDPFAPSDNLVIFGHNMADHTMFGELLDYRYYNHYVNNKYIRFDTLYEAHTYEICAVFRTVATEGQGFAYHRYTDFTSQEQFDYFMSECRRLSLYEVDCTAVYGDKLITLSTCDFYTTDGRLILVAKQIT